MRRALARVLAETRIDILRRLGHAAPAALFPARLLGREDRLFAALGGALSFELLRTAHDVGLFSLLHRRPGLRADEIAAALGLGSYPTEILLLGLVSLGLVERIGDRHHNDPLLSPLLGGTLSGEGLGEILRFFQRVINPAAAALEASVREGRPAGLARLFGPGAGSYYEALGRDPVLGPCFREAMAADTRLNRDRVASSPLFAACRRLLDVGGSSGELALAIAAHHPSLRITVLDFPEAAARARERFRAAGVADRLAAASADLRIDPLPREHDGVLFAHFLDIFSPARVRALLAEAHACLPDGGSVFVFGSVMRDDERGPLMYGVLSAYFLCLAGGEGRFYTAAQLEGALRAAGFVDLERTALPRSEVLLRGVKRSSPAPSRLRALVRLGRPAFLAYSLLLHALGSAAVVAEGRALDLGASARGLAFVWCAHLATHYVNERFDLAADRVNRAPTRWTGGSRVLVEGHLPPSASLGAAVVFSLAATALALGLPGAGTKALALGVLALGWAYTAPPLSLNYRGLGELTVAAVLDLGVPLLAVAAQRGGLAAPPALIAAAVPLFVVQAARMLVMNLADRDGDRAAGKRTLAVRLGRDRAARVAAAAHLGAHLALVGLAAAGLLPLPVAGAMLLTSPLAALIVRRVLGGAPRDAREAERLAFWSSTHAALLGAAATLGLLAGAPRTSSAAIVAAVLAAYGLLLVEQVRRAAAGPRP